MGWITLECTSPCLGMWSMDFFFLSFFEVEKSQRHRVHLVYKGQRGGHALGRWEVGQLSVGHDARRSLPMAEVSARLGARSRRADTKGQGGQWGNSDFWSGQGLNISGRSYVMDHCSREGTQHAVHVLCYRTAALPDFPAAFQIKDALGWLLATSMISRAGLGAGKSCIK